MGAFVCEGYPYDVVESAFVFFVVAATACCRQDVIVSVVDLRLGIPVPVAGDDGVRFAREKRFECLPVFDGVAPPRRFVREDEGPADVGVFAEDVSEIFDLGFAYPAFVCVFCV